MSTTVQQEQKRVRESIHRETLPKQHMLLTALYKLSALLTYSLQRPCNWSSASVVNHHLLPDPAIHPLGFDLSWRPCSTLNLFWTVHFTVLPATWDVLYMKCIPVQLIVFKDHLPRWLVMCWLRRRFCIDPKSFAWSSSHWHFELDGRLKLTASAFNQLGQ